MRVVILAAAFAAAYLIWVAVYLLPHTRDEVFSDANLRRAFHGAIRY